MRIETPRLIMRTLRLEDAVSITRNIGNLNVSRWLLVVPYPYRKKDAINWLKKNREKARKRKKDDYSFGIELKAEHVIIGGIGIHHIDKYHGRAEIGYWLGQDYWRKGYGSEALKAILNFAFKELKLRRLEAGVYVGNPSSGKLLEKYGFKKEGTKKQAVRCKADGKLKDEYIYGLLKRDYHPKK